MNDNTPLFGTRRCGSAATKVQIASPMGSRWDGQIGTVVEVIAASHTVMVRFGRDERPLPFARSEIVRIEG